MLCFFSFAYAEDDKKLPDLELPYYVVFKSTEGYYYIYTTEKPLTSFSATYYNQRILYYSSKDGSHWNREHDFKNGCATTFGGKGGVCIASNYNVVDDKGNVLFRCPPAPFSWKVAQSERIVEEVKKVAIIAVGLIVLVIAFRKGWSLLRNSLKGL